MSLPILYSFRRCPYAIRARMALLYAGVELEHREILLKDKPQAMLDVSEKGTVPVLVLADNVFDESIEVMQWALEQNDPNSWLSHGLEHELILDNDHKFKPKLDRYKYFERYPEQSQQYYLEECLVFLQKLERSLVDAQLSEEGGEGMARQEIYFLLSTRTTVLDIAIFPFVRQFALVDKTVFDGLNLPKLQIWLDYFLNHSFFSATMVKRPLWKNDLV